MLVVDVETTGLNAQRNSIVSIGAVDFRRPDRRFFGECRIWDGAEIQAEALNVNGFTREQVTDPSKQSLGELMSAFVAWVRESDDQMIAGQAPTFDHGFLRASANRCNIDWFPGWRMVDLQTIAYVHYLKRGIQPPLNSKGTPGLSLDVTAKYCGLSEEPRPHIASNGAMWEAECFGRLIYGKNLLREFRDYPVPDYLQSAG